MIPESTREFVARSVERSIRQREPVRTGYGKDHTEVEMLGDGTLKIMMPYYMRIQNDGMRPFVMHALEGRRIPMPGPGGRIQIRTVSRVGGHRITARDARGRIAEGNRPIRWRHPGLAPKNFIELGIEDNRRLLTSAYLGTLIKDLHA